MVMKRDVLLVRSPQRTQSAQRFFSKEILCGSLSALWFVSCLLFTGVTLSAQRGGGPPAAAQAHPAIGNREAIAEGEKLYNETCTACHGKDGRGTMDEYPDLAGQHADYLAQALNDYRLGKRKSAIMQPFVQQLTRDDIEALASYFSKQPGLETPSLD